MRRDQILKICLNHDLTNDTQYTMKDSKSWHFVANEFSENEYHVDQFCLRFKSDKEAADFKHAIDNALHSTAILASDETSKIVQLKLPANFFDHKKNRTECTGCRGCNADAFIFPEVKEINLSQTINNNAIPLMLPGTISI